MAETFGAIPLTAAARSALVLTSQLLRGAYSALSRQIGLGKVTMHTRSEMLDVVLVDGHAKGIVVRDMVTGEISRHSAHAVVLEGLAGLEKGDMELAKGRRHYSSSVGHRR